MIASLANVLLLVFMAVAVSAACTRKEDSVTLGGEVIELSTDPAGVTKTMDHPGLPQVLVTSERGKIGVGIFQSGTGQPYLQLGDTNSDGVFDMLSYSALTKDGENLIEVEDYGMDGQADFILNSKESSATVFYHGTWYPVDGVGSGQPPTVEIGRDVRLLSEVLEEIGRKPF